MNTSNVSLQHRLACCLSTTKAKVSNRGLLGIVLTLGLAACGGGSDPAPPEPPTAESVQIAAPIAFNETTFAGKTSDANVFAAVVTHAAGVEAYFCDGTRDFWFRGLASDSTIEMSDASGAKLSVDIARDIVAGQLTVDGVVTPFELPKSTPEALFRADTQVGGQRVLAGWIVLPSGEQRGVIRNGTLSQASTLNLSKSAIPEINCTKCDGFRDALTPAPFTPEAAQRKANSPQEFTIIGLGDSFMSGEGAPITNGQFSLAGVFLDGVGASRETWSSGLPTSRGQRTFNLSAAQRTRLAREALACHRGAAGLGLAVDALRQSWPASVEIVHQTFACSGAKVKHLINENYSGPANCGQYPARIAALEAQLPNPIAGLQLAALQVDYAYCKTISDDTDTYSIRAQLPETIEFLNAQRLKVDAVVMSIGGNDMGFGDIISDCVTPGTNCASPDSKAQAALTKGKENLPQEYEKLSTAFSNSGVHPSNVYLTSHPTPLSKTADRLCAGTDFLPDLLLVNLSDQNVNFAASVHREINTQTAAAVRKNEWKGITSHIDSAVGRGMCAAIPWYNTRNAALSQQGEDIPSDASLLNLASVIPLLPTKIELSAGMFHPNARGHLEGYMPAYRDVLDTALIQRFTPKTPTRLRPAAFYRDSQGRTSVEVIWDDVNEHESKTVITNSAGNSTESVGVDIQRKTISLDRTNAASISVKACLDRPGNNDLCSAGSAALRVEAKVPTHLPRIENHGPFPTILRDGEIVYLKHVVGWKDLAPSRMWSTLEIDTAGTITRQAVSGQQTFIPVATGLDRFRLAACNSLGCGPATAWTNFKELPPQTIPVPPPCPTGQSRVGQSCQRQNVRP